MNTVEHVVVKVLSEPYFNHLWCVDVEANAWGSAQKTKVLCATKEKAEQIKVGYKFDA